MAVPKGERGITSKAVEELSDPELIELAHRITNELESRLMYKEVKRNDVQSGLCEWHGVGRSDDKT